MNPISREEFELRYKIGKSAFEQGRYRISVDNLLAAEKLVSPYTRRGGEVKMWLVNAYQALGNTQKAIDICQELTTHPHGETKRQAQKLLYIIKAPQLERPPEWMTKIPDLNAQENSQKYQPVTTKKKKPQPKRQIELVDLNAVNTQDNNFIWITLLFSCLALGGFFIFS